MRAKEYLVKHGHLGSAGRGRMPNRVLPILKEAVEKGVVFSDWPKNKDTTAKTNTSATTSTQTPKPKIESNGVAELATYRFDEDNFMAVEKGTKIERSLRSACNNCCVSLVICYCPTPRIVKRDGSGSVEVTIKRRS